MYDKRIKFAGGTFNDSFTSLDKIQHIHTSICFVKNWLGKPMPTSFYKLTFMQTGMFFNPTVSFGHFIEPTAPYDSIGSHVYHARY